MKNLGAGIAIAGIWIGTGMVGLNDKTGWTAGVAIFAFLSTLAALSLTDTN